MSASTIGILVLVALFLIYMNNADEIETMLTRENVCNSIDGRCYNVVGKYRKVEDASKLLASLNSFGINLLRYLREKYVYNDTEYIERPAIVKFLLSNYNPDTIIENAPINQVNTSYVDDKGKVFALCLREKKSGQNNFHDENTLKFVVLHEMAHMATQSYGHEDEYWTNFKFLIQEAKAAGLYEPADFSKSPINYCSLDVDYNPYYDNSLPQVM